MHMEERWKRVSDLEAVEFLELVLEMSIRAYWNGIGGRSNPCGSDVSDDCEGSCHNYAQCKAETRAMELLKKIKQWMISDDVQVSENLVKHLQEQQLGDIPKVTAIAEWKEHHWDLYVVCPFCGEQHHHSGGYGEKPEYGTRAPHCAGIKNKDFIDGYELIPGGMVV